MSTECIDSIRELHRKRQDLHRAEKSLTLQIKAICRRYCQAPLAARLLAGEIDAAKMRSQSKADAEVLYTALVKETPHPLWLSAATITAPFFAARKVLAEQRAATEKMLERAAKQLPVVAWVTQTKGFGLGSLAAVIGEAGDLSLYASHSKLWKRMGLAVINGERQRRISGNAELAIQHAYSPVRRSIVWNIGQCVLKAQSARVDKSTGELKAPAGVYRCLYDTRKQYELDRGCTKLLAHNRALRYVDKRLLRDLWRAWRDAVSTAAPVQEVA